jgi:O-antigen ligase
MRERLSRLVAESPGAVPGAVLVALFIWFAADWAGFRGVTYLPGTLLLLALLAVLVAALPRPRPSRAAVVAIAALAAYAAWSYLSIAWADDQAIAWDGANRTVFYALALALLAMWPVQPGVAAWLVGAYALGVAAVGLVELLRAAGAANPIEYMPEGRLTEPATYANANVALFFTAFWPCAVLSSRREVFPPLRGLLLGAAGLLMGLTLLGQSRAWFFVFPLSVLIAVALVPGRGRLIVTLGALAAATGLMLDPVLTVYDDFERDVNVASQLDSATRAIVLVSAALAVLGALAAVLDSRVSLEPRTARRASTAVLGAFVAAVAIAAIAVFAVKGDPITLASDAWDDFSEGGSAMLTESSRFSGDLTSYRYDYWRVAWENFEREPLLGVGADNFKQDYLLRGESYQQPTYPHSVELRALSQTGLIGFLLLAVSFGAALVGTVRVALRGGLGGAVAATAAVGFTYWIFHGTFDWLWEFAGLGGPAIGLMGLALALRPAPETASEWRIPGPALVAGAVVAAVLAIGVTLPWIAERDYRWAADNESATDEDKLDRLERAASLNRLTPDPDFAIGLIHASQGRYGEADAAFERALDRNPNYAHAYLQLGAIASQSGRSDLAEEQIERSLALAPRDEIVRQALRTVRQGKQLDPVELYDRIRRDIDIRLGRR